MPCSTDPLLQRAYNAQAERMLLSAFIAGLSGNPGRIVRFAVPSSAEEALRIAVTVSQAEVHEVRSNAFCLDSVLANISPAGRIRDQALRHTGAKPAANNREPRRMSSEASQRHSAKRASKRSAQSEDTVQCYECSGYGHYA